MPTELTAAQFIAKWKPVTLPERAASQEHFIDLCRLLGQPTPAQHDPTGAEYTFEKGVTVTGPASRGSKGEYGYADVWWRGKFAWEYKRKDKYDDLAEAYRQLCQYREALENPPLLIVSDIRRTEIHTNFTGTRKEIHVIELNQIGHPDNLAKLRRVFTDPHSFKPTLSTFHLTENAAAEFAKIADQLRQRGHDPHVAAHFLMKCMFCLFAEDVKLLPEALFSRLLQHAKSDPAALTTRLNALFQAMKDGGYFGVENIAHFDGGLFGDAPPLPLKTYDIHTMLIAGQFDWGSIEPSIFGTLFERSLDPSKRSQIGAHYTSREDIMLIVEPVVMAPLRREWQTVQDDVAKQLQRRGGAKTDATKRKANDKIGELIQGFQHRLATLRILDPACGSGNFLYVALQELLSLEKEVIVFASKPEIGLGLFPRVRPTQLHALEINPFAAELAQVVIWIGYLQWMKDNGFLAPSDPILAPLQTIECRDAILKWKDEAGHPLPEWREGAKCAGPADWPKADFIIGNPPFLGSRLARNALGDEYVDCYQHEYGGSIPDGADYCCYWFELGRRAMLASRELRVGLLATQGIRGGSSRKILQRICGDGRIFFAVSDKAWPLEGATVHISMVGFEREATTDCILDGSLVPSINADLTAGADLASAKKLACNEHLSFQGTINSGKFDIDAGTAHRLLASPVVGDGTNALVLRPWLNGKDVTGRPRGRWIIDFREGLDRQSAARFEAPFEYVRHVVKPQRDRTKYAPSSKYPFWQLWNSRTEIRARLVTLRAYIATARVAKHRLFVFIENPTLPDAQLIAFARQDDYFFAVLHSAVHELWARRVGTQLREAESGFRYTPTTCFETFPLPWPPGSEPRPSASGPAQRDDESEPLAHGHGSELQQRISAAAKEPLAHGRGSELHQRISDAAKELNEQRERWLNPPEWIDAIAQYVDNKHDFSNVPAEARELIRQSAIMAEAARDPRLKKRTLTNLYNERPTWLRLAHEKLDRAVLAAYAAVDPQGGWSEEWVEVWVESGAGQPLPDGHALAEQRREIDQHVLASLLRLNLARAEK